MDVGLDVGCWMLEGSTGGCSVFRGQAGGLRSLREASWEGVVSQGACGACADHSVPLETSRHRRDDQRLSWTELDCDMC